MSVKILASFNDKLEYPCPYGVRHKGLVPPVSKFDLTWRSEKDRVRFIDHKIDVLGQTKGLEVECCVHSVEHTNTPGRMIIDPKMGRYRVGQNAYRFVPSYGEIVGGKIISVSLYKFMYSINATDEAMSFDFWIVVFKAHDGKNTKPLWVTGDGLILNANKKNGDNNDYWLYTNKAQIQKDYRDARKLCPAVRAAYGNVKMKIA